MLDFKALLSLFEEEWVKLNFVKEPLNLYEPIQYFLNMGGKRIRPVALLMTTQLFSDKLDNAKHAAKAVELFHNFTLVHDDIMDAAPTRRGFETVHEKWNLPIGILSGDALNIIAYQQLAKIDKEYLNEILDLFNTTAIQVCEGQQMDMDFEQRNNVSLDEYIEMISLKTSVLLAASIKMGAILGNASTKDAEHLYEFGKNVGISFQIKDDYLDAFGSSDKTGKQIGGDILANKKTYLMLKAKQIATENQKQKLNTLQQSNNSTKVDDTLQLLQELNIPEITIKAKQYYSDIAFEHLAKVSINNEAKEALEKLAYLLLDREN
jgi:geranylgeranyl diphosphate synthase, type II